MVGTWLSAWWALRQTWDTGFGQIKVSIAQSWSSDWYLDLTKSGILRLFKPHQALSQAPTGLSLIAYFPLLLKIHSKYSPVYKITHCTIRTVTKDVTTSGLSTKPQRRWPRWLRWVWTRLPKPEYSAQASLARVGLTLWTCWSFNSFGKPSQRFLRVLGISPKSLESSLRKARCSLGFLCDPRISVYRCINTRPCLF